MSHSFVKLPVSGTAILVRMLYKLVACRAVSGAAIVVHILYKLVVEHMRL